MEIILWIMFGALAGWIASLVMGTDAEQGSVSNVVIGVLGALIGGMVTRVFGASGITGFNLSSLLVAILGAVIFLFILKAATNRG